jgi:hypothetical protein
VALRHPSPFDNDIAINHSPSISMTPNLTSLACMTLASRSALSVDRGTPSAPPSGRESDGRL